MKLNIEVELDWLDEESNIDDIIKAEVIRDITKQVSENAIKKFEEQALEKINKVYEKVETKIDELVTKEFNSFMNKPIKITDQWGDVKKEYNNVSEMIKLRFDNWLLEKVDKYGKPSSYGDFNRMNYFIDGQLQAFSKKFTEETVKEMRSRLESTLTNDMKELLGGQMMDVIGVKKLLAAASDKALK